MAASGALTASDLQAALVGFGSNCLWNPQRVQAARNTTGVAGWEADLLLIHPSGWTWEVEVKVTASDFRREFTVPSKKIKHQALVAGRNSASWRNWDGGRGKETLIRRFFFAMPVAVWEKVKAEVPDYAGVILFDPEKRDSWGRLRPWIERRGKDLPARRATDEDRERLRTAVYFRYWDLKEVRAGVDGAEGVANDRRAEV